MICLVDMEHPQAIHHSAWRAGEAGRARSRRRAYLKDIQRRLEETSHDDCLVRRYTEITEPWLDHAAIRALVVSGNVTEWQVYDEADLRALGEIVRSASLPILGLCGGLQFMAMAHGGSVGPIRKLESGEEDVDTGLGAGYLKEWGFTPVRVIRSDPLFEGLPPTSVFLEAHYWEVKRVPDGFELLASTDTCRIQALRRTGTLVYGTQFHPEAYIAHPADRHHWLIELVYPAGYSVQQLDGRQLLANFFRLAGII